MKKYLATLMGITITSLFTAHAQDVYFGINGGYLNNKKIMTDASPLPSYLRDVNSTALLNGFVWGLHVGYNFSNRWGIEAQLQFTNEGYKEQLELLYHFQDGPIVGTKLAAVERYRNYHYTRIPLLAHYNLLSPAATWSIRLMAGPNLGILTRQSSDYVGLNELGKEVAPTLDLEDKPFKKMDLGFQVGIRIQKQVYQDFHLFLEAAAYQGLFNTINMPDVAYNEPTPSYYYENNINRHMMATIGIQYALPLSKNR